VGIENPVHLLFVAVVALVVLGPKRLPELARALGKGVREFREAINGEGAHDAVPGMHDGVPAAHDGVPVAGENAAATAPPGEPPPPASPQ
jgi:TatA/E family protein of Tat protein translocase